MGVHRDFWQGSFYSHPAGKPYVFSSFLLLSFLPFFLASYVQPSKGVSNLWPSELEASVLQPTALF